MSRFSIASLIAFLLVSLSCTKEASFLNDSRIVNGVITVEVGTVTRLDVPELLAIKWTSDNEDVAYVAGGYLFSQNLGTAKITGICGKNREEFTVVVVPVALESFNLVDKSIALYYGEETEIRVTDVMPEHATAASIGWKCSEEGIVDIKYREGKVMARAIGIGSTYVVASNGDITASCSVTVKDISSFSINETSASLLSGETSQLIASQQPKTVFNVKWTSSDPSVATVNESGLVTAGSTSGKAVISAEAVGSKLPPVSCQVSVIGDDYKIKIFYMPTGEEVHPRSFVAPDEDFTEIVKKVKFKVCMEDGSLLPETLVSQLRFDAPDGLPEGFELRHIDNLFNVVHTGDKYFFGQRVTLRVTAPNGSTASFEYTGYPKSISVLVPASGIMTYQMISDLASGVPGAIDQFKYVVTTNFDSKMTVNPLDVEKGFVLGLNWSYITTCCSVSVSASAQSRLNEFTKDGTSISVGHAYKSGSTGTHLDYLKPYKNNSVYNTGETKVTLAGTFVTTIDVR